MSAWDYDVLDDLVPLILQRIGVTPSPLLLDPPLNKELACIAIFSSTDGERTVELQLRYDMERLVSYQEDGSSVVGPMCIGGPVEEVADKIVMRVQDMLRDATE